MIIDFHQHIKAPFGKNQELRAPVSNLSAKLCEHDDFLKSLRIVKANVIFNSEMFVFSRQVQNEIKKYYAQGKRRMLFTFMPSLSSKDCIKRLNKLLQEESIASGLKFHSFFQRIDEAKFDRAVELAKVASGHNLFIIIDGSVGSENFYNYDSFKLLIKVCKAVSTPIIFAHAGSFKIKEALLIGLDYPHLYFDTSFSLSFWSGSSVEKDFSFAIKKLGPARFLFGSDYPLCNLKKELAFQKNLLAKFGLSRWQIDQILGGSAGKLLGKKGID